MSEVCPKCGSKEVNPVICRVCGRVHAIKCQRCRYEGPIGVKM